MLFLIDVFLFVMVLILMIVVCSQYLAVCAILRMIWL